jgi:L-glyceraldehyde 3-phosphate reductase
VNPERLSLFPRVDLFFLRLSLSGEYFTKVKKLSGTASQRGQSLAQKAPWWLRDWRETSVLNEPISPEKITKNVAALFQLNFTPKELSEIGMYANESGINL